MFNLIKLLEGDKLAGVMIFDMEFSNGGIGL